MNNNPQFAGIDKISLKPNENSRLFNPDAWNTGFMDWANSFKNKPLTPMQQAAMGTTPSTASGPMPMFSDMGSVVTPQATPSMFGGNQFKTSPAAGVTPFNLNQVQTPTRMFTGSFGNDSSLTGIDTSQAWAAQPQTVAQTPAWNNMVDATSQMPQQVIPQAAQQQVIQQPSSPAVNPVLAQQKALGVTQDGILGPITNRAQAISDYQDAIIGGADPATLTNPYTLDAMGTESELSAITTPPITGTSMWDDITKSLGLSDMTTKDIYSGIGAGAQIGINAYGMFKGLDQMDTRLDQGQQALDLNREEYDENLRHRRAIVAQNKGA